MQQSLLSMILFLLNSFDFSTKRFVMRLVAIILGYLWKHILAISLMLSKRWLKVFALFRKLLFVWLFNFAKIRSIFALESLYSPSELVFCNFSVKWAIQHLKHTLHLAHTDIHTIIFHEIEHISSTNPLFIIDINCHQRTSDRIILIFCQLMPELYDLHLPVYYI